MKNYEELAELKKELKELNVKFDAVREKNNPLTSRIRKVEKEIEEINEKISKEEFEKTYKVGDFVAFYDCDDDAQFGSSWIEVSQITNIGDSNIWVGNGGKLSAWLEFPRIIRKATRQEMIDRIDGKEITEGYDE